MINFIENQPYKTKVIIGKFKYPIYIVKRADRLWLDFSYNRLLMEEIKTMEGARWHGYEDPPIKQWSIVDSLHNQFQLEYLEGKNPYIPYDKPLIEFTPRRTEDNFPGLKFYRHQGEIASHVVTRQYCVVAGETGVGKTLAIIEAIEWLAAHKAISSWFYIAPKSALTSVQIEFEKWKSVIIPQFFTYDKLVTLLKHWPKESSPPQGVVFDESSRTKNPTAQRTLAALHLADAIRAEWGDRGAVVLMSGTPAPKSPLDYYSQCKIARPGFLKEGSVEKLRKRLAFLKQSQSESGQAFTQILGWRDDKNKCDTCGKLADDPDHDEINMTEAWFHAFKPSVNEVELLYKRMNGLVIVKKKRECFSGDSFVLTKQGPRKFKELAEIGNADLYVLTDDGMQWINCEVKAFGLKETYELTFGDHSKTRATLHHEWLYRSRGILRTQKLMTIDLKEGKTELPLAPIVLNRPDDEGYAHGFVFGEGTRQNKNRTKVPLYGSDVDLKPLLLKFGNLSWEKRGAGWESYLDVIASLPLHWKELPKNPTKEYALGFILGLVAADGCSDEHLRIYQAHLSHILKINHMAIYAGLRVSPVRIAREFSPLDGSYKPLYYFSIQTYNINPEWILRKDHRSKMKTRGRKTSTTVSNIDYLSGRKEETYCAVVPKWHNFTLANGVITGNCLDLPDKQFRIIHCKPTASILNAAKLIAARGESVIKTMMLCRELSDGFQYVEQEMGTQTCELCSGEKFREDWEYIGPEELRNELTLKYFDDHELASGQEIPSEHFTKVRRACPHCNGTGTEIRYIREAAEVPCPKEDVLIDLMDQYDEVGRLVVYAGFTGSINRCVNRFLNHKWDVIRADGRGWWSNNPGDAKTLLKRFQNSQDQFPRIAFIAQPGAAGMGLNLTASPAEIFYSNDFNAESRMQAIDRIHRPGMDINRGATIYDLIHLPTDQLVLDNLNKKKRLQDITMGEFKSALDSAIGER